MMRALILGTLLLHGVVHVAFGAEYYVSPTGSPNGYGTLASPWDLTTALAHPPFVKPGDTIWLRGGTYRGTFTSELRGTTAAPIIVRQYPGERATIDGAPTHTSFPALTINGFATWFWGFEVTNSSTAPRVLPGTSFDGRAHGVFVLGPDTKLINLVIHDNGGGIGLWERATNAEIYGNIVYYNGYSDANRGHGEGVYLQNRNGVKRVVDNVFFSQCDNGIIAYGSSNSALDNVHYEGNIVFLNGIVATNPGGTGIIIGGGVLAQNHTVLSNYFYNPVTFFRGLNMDPSYREGSNNVTLQDNYSASDRPINYDIPIRGLSATGNTFIGRITPTAASQLSPSANTFHLTPPSTNRVFMRRNQYEPDKAYVAAYNWTMASHVDLDVTGFLAPGQGYEVRAMQDYFGPPVAQGRYTSGPIQLPMNITALAAPVGNLPRPPVSTFPQFGAFQIRKTELLIEAESGTLEAPMAVHDHPTASGRKHITSAVANSGTASYLVNIPRPGTYYVWARVFAGNRASDTFYVSFDSDAEDVFDMAEDSPAPGWRWSLVSGRGRTNQPRAIDPRTFNLTAGPHTLRIRMREASTLLDQFIITDNPNFRPVN